MKRFVRIVCLIVVFSLLMVFPAQAAEPDTRASSYFSAYRAYCYAVTSTKMEVWFHVIATGEMDELGTSIIKVQRSSDGTNWTTMKTYTKESYSQMIETDTGVHAACVTYTRTAGYYYRAHVTFYAKNSLGTGELYYYTAKI